MLTVIQIILVLFIFFALTRVILRLRDKIISPKMAIFWSAIWLAALTGVLLPKTTTELASIFGVGRGVDVIVYISLALLFYMVFRIYVMIQDVRQEITSIIRKVALENASKTTRKTPKTKNK